MINFACPKCNAQLTFADNLGGSDGLCPTCHEMIYIPILDDNVTGVKVSKSAFSNKLMDFVKTKASDIDDDVTDNKFLVAKESRSAQNNAVKKFLDVNLEDIDDDLTDNKYLDAKAEKPQSFSPGLQSFIKESREAKKKRQEEEGG